MFFDIKELRESTGMTQKSFAETYGIPLSTLRKWEQKEASPAPYVVNLLARALPQTDSSFQKIAGKAEHFIIMTKRGNSSLTCAETKYILKMT